MGSTFNPQILVEKLAKLNNSQASIETLSHWCIFHMNKAQQVVETWARQFHCSPREQRLAFLYLANDILQNSRRKGSEFVGEFWRVLPDALRDVVHSGDDFGRNAALRLIGIWEERKVFGSRAQILKEELIGKPLDSSNRNGKHFSPKLKQVAGLSMDKIVSGYQAVYSSHIDEDVILGKCQNAISYLEKVEKEFGTDINSGKFHGSSIMEELQGQHSVLRDCIEHLLVVESSRATLVSHLKEALREQESKLDQVRNQLQAAQSQSEQTGNTCRQLTNNVNVQSRVEQNSMESHTSMAPHSFPSFPGKSGNVEDDPRKSAAAAVAAKLTASTSSAQMLSYVLSSLASEGVIGNPVRDPSGSIDYPPEKRHKLEIDQTPYMNNPQPFSQAETMPHNQQQYTPTNLPPPPSSSPPPLPPIPSVQQYPVAQFMTSTSGQYTYSMIQQPQQAPLSAYPTIGAPATGISPYIMPTNSYQNHQSSEGNLYNQPSSLPMAPISRQ